MTVIAWDGKMLAADKLADWGGTKMRVTKVHPLPNGEVAAMTGCAARAMAMLRWYKEGALPESFRYERNVDQQATLIIASAQGVRCYSHTPFPEQPDPGPTAYGWGRDFALAAMACGRNAAEAVHVANQLCSKTGLGVDWVTPGGEMQTELG